MNQNFIKVLRSDGYHPKKGYHWAINPARYRTLQLEIDRTLRIMGRSLIENSSKAAKHNDSKAGYTYSYHVLLP